MTSLPQSQSATSQQAAATSSPTAAAASTKPPARLLTEAEVLAALSAEIAAASLTEVAERYDIKPSQISDVLYGRANLSSRMLERLKLRMHKFYERLPR